MNKTEFARAAKDVGFHPIDAVLQLARPTVRLRPAPASSTGRVVSQLGGLPALSPESAWPSRDGKSLAFIAQVKLDDMPGFVASEGFPSSGVLSFFYDSEQSTWGFDPKDSGSFALLLTPDADDAKAVEDWPDDIPEYARYQRCELLPEEIITLPPWDSLLIEQLQLSDQQAKLYVELTEGFASDQSWASRTLFGGHPDQVQGDMMLECELVSAGLYCGDATAYQDARLPQFKEQAKSWRQILQVESCDDAGMMWGDCGCLYYWMRDSDLRSRQFDRAWMVLQCG